MKGLIRRLFSWLEDEREERSVSRSNAVIDRAEVVITDIEAIIRDYRAADKRIRTSRGHHRPRHKAS
jgi:hypothetical protein